MCDSALTAKVACSSAFLPREFDVLFKTHRVVLVYLDQALARSMCVSRMRKSVSAAAQWHG